MRFPWRKKSEDFVLPGCPLSPDGHVGGRLALVGKSSVPIAVCVLTYVFLLLTLLAKASHTIFAFSSFSSMLQGLLMNW